MWKVQQHDFTHSTPNHSQDPNKGVAMFESASIVQYLNDTYAIAE